ncbi:hypothetical protein VOLCADRAFT_90158 [Volvox carteri f. nagariensis]|uniref:Uncharacterized protein n=1 Tax=Volvox carteri f. nagariensis TaxID=3068 RepID=D8TTM3_VOLCA|nr:uncharacterized protein VOLCADRAFT_90158 [Volvox carteri f. nagariensis]EFJ49332.1 hypothetical protein VOLCADRAFT_90158 [Volvox carteri f. nagariensis]|eukprot:XP_002949780.1 hypothetical protein VOLCADRAFT_90158 [Volvox carteri f. nagariensis]
MSGVKSRHRDNGNAGFFSRIWTSDILDCVVAFLPPNVVACTIRLVNKLAAEQFKRYSTTRLSQLVPCHAFRRRWADPSSLRTMTYEERMRFLCLVASSGSIYNLKVAMQSTGLQLHSRILCAAAKAGRIDLCAWLVDEGCPSDAMGLGDAVGYSQSKDLFHFIFSDGIFFDIHVIADDDESYGNNADGFVAAIWAALCAAARNGHDDFFRWLLQQLPQIPRLSAHSDSFGIFEPADLFEAVAEGCKLSTLKWLSRRKRLPPLWMGPNGTGCLTAVRMLLELGPTSVVAAALEAANAGHLHVLQALHAFRHLAQDAAEDGEPEKWLLHEALVGGHLQVVAWLVEVLGVDVRNDADLDLMLAAAKSGSLDMVVWLHERGCPWHVDGFMNAVKVGNTAVLEYMAENGCPVPQCGTPYVHAVRVNDLSVMRCLRRLGVQWHPRGRTFTACVKVGRGLWDPAVGRVKDAAPYIQTKRLFYCIVLGASYLQAKVTGVRRSWTPQLHSMADASTVPRYQATAAVNTRHTFNEAHEHGNGAWDDLKHDITPSPPPRSLEPLTRGSAGVRSSLLSMGQTSPPPPNTTFVSYEAEITLPAALAAGTSLPAVPGAVLHLSYNFLTVTLRFQLSSPYGTCTAQGAHSTLSAVVAAAFGLPPSNVTTTSCKLDQAISLESFGTAVFRTLYGSGSGGATGVLTGLCPGETDTSLAVPGALVRGVSTADSSFTGCQAFVAVLLAAMEPLTVSAASSTGPSLSVALTQASCRATLYGRTASSLPPPPPSPLPPALLAARPTADGGGAAADMMPDGDGSGGASSSGRASVSNGYSNKSVAAIAAPAAVGGVVVLVVLVVLLLCCYRRRRRELVTEVEAAGTAVDGGKDTVAEVRTPPAAAAAAELTPPTPKISGRSWLWRSLFGRRSSGSSGGSFSGRGGSWRGTRVAPNELKGRPLEDTGEGDDGVVPTRRVRSVDSDALLSASAASLPSSPPRSSAEDTARRTGTGIGVPSSQLPPLPPPPPPGQVPQEPMLLVLPPTTTSADSCDGARRCDGGHIRANNYGGGGIASGGGSGDDAGNGGLFSTVMESGGSGPGLPSVRKPEPAALETEMERVSEASAATTAAAAVKETAAVAETEPSTPLPAAAAIKAPAAIEAELQRASAATAAAPLADASSLTAPAEPMMLVAAAPAASASPSMLGADVGAGGPAAAAAGLDSPSGPPLAPASPAVTSSHMTLVSGAGPRLPLLPPIGGNLEHLPQLGPALAPRSLPVRNVLPIVIPHHPYSSHNHDSSAASVSSPTAVAAAAAASEAGGDGGSGGKDILSGRLPSPAVRRSLLPSLATTVPLAAGSLDVAKAGSPFAGPLSLGQQRTGCADARGREGGGGVAAPLTEPPPPTANGGSLRGGDGAAASGGGDAPADGNNSAVRQLLRPGDGGASGDIGDGGDGGAAASGGGDAPADGNNSAVRQLLRPGDGGASGDIGDGGDRGAAASGGGDTPAGGNNSAVRQLLRPGDGGASGDIGDGGDGGAAASGGGDAPADGSSSAVRQLLRPGDGGASGDIGDGGDRGAAASGGGDAPACGSNSAVRQLLRPGDGGASGDGGDDGATASGGGDAPACGGNSAIRQFHRPGVGGLSSSDLQGDDDVAAAATGAGARTADWNPLLAARNFKRPDGDGDGGEELGGDSDSRAKPPPAKDLAAPSPPPGAAARAMKYGAGIAPEAALAESSVSVAESELPSSSPLPAASPAATPPAAAAAAAGRQFKFGGMADGKDPDDVDGGLDSGSNDEEELNGMADGAGGVEGQKEQRTRLRALRPAAARHGGGSLAPDEALGSVDLMQLQLERRRKAQLEQMRNKAAWGVAAGGGGEEQLDHKEQERGDGLSSVQPVAEPL